MKNFNRLIAFMAMAFFVVSCTWEDEKFFDSPENTLLKSAISYDNTDWPDTYCGTVEYHDLIADQDNNTGNVAVVNDGEFLYVKYTVDPGYLLIETHVQLGELPVNKNGIPKIGAFDYATENYDGTDVVLHKISLDGMDDCFDVFAHAVVVCTDESGEILYDEFGEYVCEETAWGAGGGEDLVFALKSFFSTDYGRTWAVTTGGLFNTGCYWATNFGYIDLDLGSLPATHPLVPGGTSGSVEVKMNEAGNALVFTITGEAGPNLTSYLYIGSVNEIYNTIESNGCADYVNFPYSGIGVIEVPLSELSLPSTEYEEFETARWGFYFNYCTCD